MSTSKNNEQNGKNKNQDNCYTVYMHVNKENGKKYIGITKQNPKKRWQNGKGYIGCTHFYNAIKKYGWDNFEHEIVFSNLTHQEANDKERELIKQYNTNNPEYGYNSTLGGDGFLGMPRKKETKEKLSKSVKKYYENHHGYWYGKTIPQEMIDKQIATKKKNPYRHTEEWKKKHSEQLKGGNNSNALKVRCITTDMEFDCIKDAAKYYNTDNSLIGKCCKGIGKSAGKHPTTGEKLFWEYIDKEYPRTEIEVRILEQEAK